MESADGDFEVRTITQYEQRGREDFYRVAWEGYGHEHDTWEPRKNILNPSEQTSRLMRTLKERATALKAVRKREEEWESTEQHTSSVEEQSRIDESAEETQSRTLNLTETDGRKTVLNIKKELDGEMYALCKEDDGAFRWWPVSSFRFSHTQSLLDYLLGNIRFMNTRGEILSAILPQSLSNKATGESE